jgi:hypothetical protein
MTRQEFISTSDALFDAIGAHRLSSELQALVWSKWQAILVQGVAREWADSSRPNAHLIALADGFINSYNNKVAAYEYRALGRASTLADSVLATAGIAKPREST